MSLTAPEIEYALLRRLFAQHFVIPRYAPANWWECDVFCLTDSGYYREYEIKVSRSDFKADAAKVRDYGPYSPRPTERKHDLLANRDPRGPVQFWYVTTKGLIDLAQVPVWAGLIEVLPGQVYQGGRCSPEFHELKGAPRLHRQKADPKIVEHARGVCYYRYHNLLRPSKPGESEI